MTYSVRVYLFVQMYLCITHKHVPTHTLSYTCWYLFSLSLSLSPGQIYQSDNGKSYFLSGSGDWFVNMYSIRVSCKCVCGFAMNVPSKQMMFYLLLLAIILFAWNRLGSWRPPSSVVRMWCTSPWVKVLFVAQNSGMMTMIDLEVSPIRLLGWFFWCTCICSDC